MKRMVNNLIFIGAIILSGCQLFEKDYGCPDLTVTPSPSDSTNLIGPIWVFQLVEICDEPPMIADPERLYIFQFSDSGTISGWRDCNTLRGTYSISENNQIEIGPLGGTKKGCGDLLDYRKYFFPMVVDHYDIRDETLRLINSTDKYVLVFTVQE